MIDTCTSFFLRPQPKGAAADTTGRPFPQPRRAAVEAGGTLECRMGRKPPFIERRADVRYRARSGAFAVFPVELELGPIEEISRSGLSFCYIPLNEPESTRDELEIYFTEDEFHLKAIPVRVISNISVDEDLPFQYVEKRRFGVRFGELTVFQRIQLDHFLENYTERPQRPASKRALFQDGFFPERKCRAAKPQNRSQG